MSVLANRKPRSRSFFKPSPASMLVSYLLLGLWAFVVMFPLYWLFVTSFKLPVDVNGGPFYVPWVDFKPTLENWHYIFFDLRNDTFRPYWNTIVVSITSTLLALSLGATAAYALSRFTYRPRVGAILTFIGCVALVIIAINLGLKVSL